MKLSHILIGSVAAVVREEAATLDASGVVSTTATAHARIELLEKEVAELKSLEADSASENALVEQSDESKIATGATSNVCSKNGPGWNYDCWSSSYSCEVKVNNAGWKYVNGKERCQRTITWNNFQRNCWAVEGCFYSTFKAWSRVKESGSGCISKSASNAEIDDACSKNAAAVDVDYYIKNEGTCGTKC